MRNVSLNIYIILFHLQVMRSHCSSRTSSSKRPDLRTSNLSLPRRTQAPSRVNQGKLYYPVECLYLAAGNWLSCTNLLMRHFILCRQSSGSEYIVLGSKHIMFRTMANFSGHLSRAFLQMFDRAISQSFLNCKLPSSITLWFVSITACRLICYITTQIKYYTTQLWV